MKRYYVISPLWDEVEPVTDDGQGPLCSCCDVVEVEAEGVADARVLGLKLLRQRPSYHHWRGYNSHNDFAGLRVEAIEDCT